MQPLVIMCSEIAGSQTFHYIGSISVQNRHQTKICGVRNAIKSLKCRWMDCPVCSVVPNFKKSVKQVAPVGWSPPE